MTQRLIGSLREAPTTVPALAAIVLFLVWAPGQAGYPLTHWAPGGLILLALLAIALLAVPLRLGAVPTPVKVALACLAAYTALSFCSIAWASVPASAWEGADRTLLYLIVFALFACFTQRGPSAALLLCLWTLALSALALYTLVRLDTVGGGTFAGMLTGERLSYPAGYANADAALWLMAFWPALLLARGRALPWALRGALAAGAVVLADVALLSLSRGSLYATPVMLVLVFAFVPERPRTFATAVPVALGVGAAAPLVLRVGDRIEAGQSPHAAIHTALMGILAAALVVGVVVAAGAFAERRIALSPARARGVRRGVGAVALATLVAILAGGLIAAGNPVTRVRHAWDSFKGGYAADASGNRLLSGLGSNRYDFYRVALDEFLAHPLLGIGADNFQQQYLAHRRSEETPRYPHSVELRTLSQTGLVGSAIAVVGLAAALLAGWRAMRRRDLLARTVAAAALSGFAYWAVHGSFDWFFEYAGLGAPAFALLGLACSLSTAPPVSDPELAGLGAPTPVLAGDAELRATSTRNPLRWGAALAAVVLGLAAAASLIAPWLSERQIDAAAAVWAREPLTAYERLEDAARLDPLSDRPYLVAGSIALRFGDLARARHDFSRALERVPDGSYATLELGAIASEANERTRALALLQRAARLNPRDPLTREALRTVRAGGRVDVAKLNQAILMQAQRLV